MSLQQRVGGGWTRSASYSARDGYDQPFATHSIWNTPIGSDAEYGPSDLAPATFKQPLGYPEVTVDPENIGMNMADPVKNLSGGEPEPLVNQPVHIPPALTADGSMNNSTAFIGTDGETIFQGQPLTLAPGGDGTMTYALRSANLYETGEYGSHGGSHLSAVGGSIRAGELTSKQPMLHALKINLYGHRFLSQDGGGFQWPATSADSGYLDTEPSKGYHSDNTTMKMGTLLALPPSADLDFIQERRVRKIAAALRDFGAYVCDNTARDVHAFCAERGAFPEVSDVADRQFHLDLMEVISLLQVVTNNTEETVGGGGTPRIPQVTPLVRA